MKDNDPGLLTQLDRKNIFDLHGNQENGKALSWSVASIGNVLHPCTARVSISCVSGDTIGALRPYDPAEE